MLSPTRAIGWMREALIAEHRGQLHSPPSVHTDLGDGRLVSDEHVVVVHDAANSRVRDIAAVCDFYTVVLGLTEVKNHGWIMTLADDSGRHQISLMTKDATAPVNPQASIARTPICPCYSPTAPSIASRRRSACPAWRDVSSVR